MKKNLAVLAAALALFALPAAPAAAQSLAVSHTTLDNGLKVVVVRDPLAPVVTTVLNYRAGSNEQEFPGQAHALEHMMFRGTPDVSQTQLFEISQLMGGNYDADTQPELTQFFFSVPQQYLDVALHVEADRARHLTLAQSGWEAESGAIKQEVTQDDSNALQKLLSRTILPALFKGTPYAKDGLGTIYSFEHLISARVLRRYYDRWYRPNNAVLVIAGNVEGKSALAAAQRYFGSLPPGKLPARPPVRLKPVTPATYHVESDQPFSIVALAYRLPGWNDKDYAAAQVLEAVLNNQRSELFALVASGKVLYAGAQDIQSHAEGTASAVFGVVPATANPQAAADQLSAVLAAYRKNGVPADLVEAAKAKALADAAFRGNSIDGLAFEWSDAVAARGARSPDQLLSQIRGVSLADVNRVLRTYVLPEHTLTAFAVPKNAGAIHAGGGGTAKENNTITPSKSAPLPAWAQAAFAHVRLPAKTLAPVSMTLSNGLRLIVQSEHVTPTVEVYGAIGSNEAIQAPADKLGVGDILEGLFPFGTTTYNRLQLRQQIDQIAADVEAGTGFSLRVLRSHFDRGVQLLADEELHPALPEQAFTIVKGQTVGALSGAMTSPAHLAEVALNKALFPPGDPAQKFATPQTAGAVTLADVHSYYASVYRPDMTDVVVIGDVTPAQAKTVFEKYFGAWKATGPKPNVALPAVPKNGPSSADVPATGRVQSDVQLVQVLDLRRASPDWAQLALGNSILGGGGQFGSMLMDDLRVVHGYVYTASSALESHKNRSIFSIEFASDPGKIVPAQSLALADLRALQTTAVPGSRLQRSKTMLISEVPLRQSSFGGVAGQLLAYAQLGLPLDQALVDARRELDATSSSVRDAMRRWLRVKDFVRIVTGPAPK